jgi:biopolymer transport protein TolR
MAFSASSSSGCSSEINVTPLIDVLLVLIIIFMVIGPTLPHGLPSSIPSDAPATASHNREPVILSVLAGAAAGQEHYRIGQQDVAFAELRPKLEAMFADRADRTLYLMADRALSYREVARAAGEGRAAGAEAVALTREER